MKEFKAAIEDHKRIIAKLEREIDKEEHESQEEATGI